VGVHRAIDADDAGDMTTLAVDVLGTAVAITAPAPLLTELQPVLGDLERGAGADRELTLMPGDRGIDLRDDGQLIRRDIDPRIAAATVVWHLNAIAGESTAHVLLHAGCVARPDGHGVLFVGGPGAGKSTLTAACVRAGFPYLSDEFGAIDRRRGQVVPYAKPLVLDGERLVTASSLGSISRQPVRPAALVFARYNPNVRPSEVTLDPSWALLALVAHAINRPALGGQALAWLAGLALACPARQVTHADAATVVPTLEREADEPAQRVVPAELLPAITSDTATVALGDSLAVLHEPSGRVHLLNPSAAAMWRSVASTGAHGRDISSLVDTALQGLDAADGTRPDHAAAAATVDRLVRSGLITAVATP
jgi:hypothetical protein